eukprot:135252-Ditylum_brightwellii.AAC.1
MFDAMYKTGLYNEKYLTWEDKTATEKTWPNWKAFLTKVVRDHQRHCKASGMNCQANSILQEDTIEVLANLASTTADDKNAVANLVAADFTLASQIKALNEHNSKQKQEIEDLNANISDILSLLQDTNLRHTGQGKVNRNQFNHLN